MLIEQCRLNYAEQIQKVMMIVLGGIEWVCQDNICDIRHIPWTLLWINYEYTLYGCQSMPVFSQGEHSIGFFFPSNYVLTHFL